MDVMSQPEIVWLLVKNNFKSYEQINEICW